MMQVLQAKDNEKTIVRIFSSYGSTFSLVVV